MKKFDFFFTLKSVLALLCSLIIITVSAQTARVQMIHNAAAAAFDSVDVYVDGIKALDNMAFRTATPLQTFPAGTYLININDRNSVDSGDLVLARFTVSLTINSNNLVMISGVDSPANYAANPNAVNTALNLVIKKGIVYAPGSTSLSSVTFINGVTDAPAVNFDMIPVASPAVTNVKYGDTTSTYFLSAQSTYVRLKSNVDGSVISAVSAPFNNYPKKSVVVFTSGFLNPSSNQNGQSLGVFTADTSGVVTPLTTVSRLQFIHNSNDITLDSIDLWLDSVKYVANLPFRSATPFLTVTSGIHVVSIKMKNSTISSPSLLQVSNVQYESNKTYLAFLSGVVDTNQYGTNPDGVSRILSFISTNTFSESAPASQFGLMFTNGVPDGPTIDLNKVSGTKTKFADNSKYNDLTPLIFTPTSSTPTTLNITNQDSSIFYGAYNISLGTSLATKTGVIFTSGVTDTFGVKANAPLMKLFIAFNNGTVTEISKLTTRLQFIHNSPDSVYEAVDIYINGIKTIAGLGFRKATPFMDVNASVPNQVAIALINSTSPSSAFYANTVNLTAGTGYYEVISGLKNPFDSIGGMPVHAVNPDKVNRAFTVYLQKGAKDTSAVSQNIDLMYHHGSPDLMKTTMLTSNGATFISKNDSFGTFHTPYPGVPYYSYNAPSDNLAFELKNAITDTILLKKYVGNISKKVGKAGLIFTSGFYANLIRDTIVFPHDSLSLTKPLTPNQRTRILGLFIAWPDGSIDTIQSVDVLLGVREVSSPAEYHAVFYPNPASDQLNISFDLKSQGSVKAELFDLNGRLVTSTQERSTNRNQIVLDLNNVQNGMYFCALTIDGNKVVRKIIVMR